MATVPVMHIFDKEEEHEEVAAMLVSTDPETGKYALDMNFFFAAEDEDAEEKMQNVIFALRSAIDGLEMRSLDDELVVLLSESDEDDEEE